MVSTSNGTTPFDVRRAGVLLHPTSLPPSPGTSGAGTLGEQAYRFVDFLAAAGLTVWQVLPLVPVHEEELSPYNALSAMAGNPALIDRARQAESGLVDAASLTQTQRAAYHAWCVDHSNWLDAYAEYSVLRDLFDRRDWQEWEPGLRDRDPARIEQVLEPHAARLEELRFEQWVFASQWDDLRAYGARAGILFFGDLPIFVAAFSSDVWANREMFELDAQGRPITVTGVPPDYFAVDGQRWNNPHYAWDRMGADDFAWWRARIGRQRELFDLVRIDHFRGFEAAWHVPVAAPTAKDGRWVKGPGREVLAALVEEAGP
ncbi:MAG: 4-alpha-glucanotransferase, partial [Terracoccus sp.]